jgi:hypothetical protein
MLQAWQPKSIKTRSSAAPGVLAFIRDDDAR